MYELYATIWRISGRRQILLIGLALAIAALAAAPLKFQKEIVNLLTYHTIGVSKLLLLCAGMMGVILLSLGLKWLMGYRAGLLGEDVIRLIRTRLVMDARERESRGTEVLTGTLSTAVSAEAEELGKFAGNAISEPVLQIGTLLSVVAFITTTQPMLGVIAFAMVTPQAIIVYFTQRRVNALVAERIRLLRSATDKIGGMPIEVAVEPVLEGFSQIYDVRRTMFHWKVSSKFLISAISGVGTVAILALGGLLVLDGRTDVGTVVAATLGFSRLQGPSAFLISFYRQVSANRVKFELLRGLILPRAETGG